MSWKTAIQLRDLDRQDRLELICRKCGHLRYLTAKELLAHKGAAQLYLDEIESRARCTQRGCKGLMRLSMPAQGETSGFVGGIS
ncbi:hypothetical protein AB1K62_03255 [Parasphingorhabdus sp. JC815]|uniref:hypothetical protein n=1 Tax=Parasphingorhabdus sp. JC815 TaxID=3232140 RepID=UPI003458E72C